MFVGRVLLGVVCALAVTAVVCDEATTKEDVSSKEQVSSMTKEQLVSKLTAANEKISALQEKLEAVTGEKHVSEKAREAMERKKKDAEKAKESAKRASKLKKKEQLSDILMNHGAKFLAFRAAKKFQDKSDEKQKTAVLEAAKKGARAGAVGPLRKVARATAVKAVKKVRAQAKKDKLSKHKIRNLSKVAAKAAVKKMLDEQDVLVEKAAQKWTEEAIKKFPPSIVLAQDDEPNDFAAPPMIHLSLDGGAAGAEVQQLKEESEKLSSKKQNVASAANAAKEAAGQIVKE